MTARESGDGLLLNQYRLDGVMYTNSKVRLADISDGTSHTVAAGESLFLAVPSGLDASGIDQFVDHWAIGSPGLAGNEVSECLGSTAAPINSFLKPNAYVEDKECGFSSRHIGGTQMVFVDGHVRFIEESINATVWSAMGTRGGGEINLDSD